MTDSFIPNSGCKRFLVTRTSTSMTATDGTGDTNLIYPFGGYSVEIDFSGLPTTTETMVVGSVTYRFIDSPSQANDVDIGVDADVTANNFRQALIDGDVSHSELPTVAGATTYHDDTVKNPDILHAELGMTDSHVHITSSSPITITTSGITNVDAIDLAGRAATSTAKYLGGNFTELKANSPEASRVSSVIIGVAAYSITGGIGGDTGWAIYSHAGDWAGGGALESPNSLTFSFAPIALPGGPAGRLTSDQEDMAAMVYYNPLK